MRSAIIVGVCITVMIIFIVFATKNFEGETTVLEGEEYTITYVVKIDRFAYSEPQDVDKVIITESMKTGFLSTLSRGSGGTSYYDWEIHLSNGDIIYQNTTPEPDGLIIIKNKEE